jgi:hypothetical protein
MPLAGAGADRVAAVAVDHGRGGCGLAGVVIRAAGRADGWAPIANGWQHLWTEPAFDRAVVAEKAGQNGGAKIGQRAPAQHSPFDPKGTSAIPYGCRVKWRRQPRDKAFLNQLIV